MPFIRLTLLAGLIAVSCYSSAQESQSILGNAWKVRSCKTDPNDMNHPDCQDPRKLLPGVTFFVAPEAPGDRWLNLELQRPRMKISIPAVDLKEGTASDGTRYVAFNFQDFTTAGQIVSKQMRIELVRFKGPDTGEECTRKLQKRLGQDFASGGKYAAQCLEDQLAYWSIGTVETVAGQKETGLTLGPPGDGHGTSTPP